MKGWLLFACLIMKFVAAQPLVTILKNTDEECIVEITFDQFTQINGELHGYSYLKHPSCIQSYQKGSPQLPLYNFSIHIPSGAHASLTSTILESETLSDIRIIPSKGNLLRTQDKKLVPYTFDQGYHSPSLYSVARIKNDFIIRDKNGIAIEVAPVQYLHQDEECRIVKKMRIRIEYDIDPIVNEISMKPVDVFEGMYKNLFVNYQKGYAHKYTPIGEQGSMLILCDPDYIPGIQPLINWKVKKGIQVFLVSSDTISGGINENTVFNLFKKYYEEKEIAFGIIVGDDHDIPTYNNDFLSPNFHGAGDHGYALQSGGDHYPDFLIGRISASHNNHVEAQVYKILQHEQSPNLKGEWMSTCLAIGSNDPTQGDENQYDWQHARAIADTLLLGPYTKKIEMYDGDKNELDLAGDPTPDMIATSMNNGLSIVNYTGHGGINGVSTGLFQTSELYRIHNYNKIWPVWFTVGCRPGYFVAYDCFAEEIMRKRDTLNRPIGALAIVASTVDQYWDPPMQAQDESNSILAGMYPDNLKYTYGAIFTNGLYSMIENYDDTNSTDGSDMADAWQYFGDPSVQLFTSYQDSISVQNPCILSPSAGSVSFQCTIADADIAIASNGSLIDHKKSNGSLVTLTIPNGIISIGDTVWITATKYNHRPFQSYMIVSNDFSACNITEFSISPNPLFNGTTVIKSPEPIQDIRVVDLNGNTQLDIISLGTNIYTLDISRLPIGLYFVQVITSSGDRKIKKLIKR